MDKTFTTITLIIFLFIFIVISIREIFSITVLARIEAYNSEYNKYTNNEEYYIHTIYKKPNRKSIRKKLKVTFSVYNYYKSNPINSIPIRIFQF